MDEDDPPDAFSWALMETKAGENGTQNEVALVGGQAKDQESYPFIYETACVPRNSCLEFHMWNPNPPEDYYDDDSPISVRLDRVIYSERDLGFDDFRNVYNRTIKLSKNCPFEIACDARSEDLFAVEYEITRVPEDHCADNDSYESSPVVESWDAPDFFLIDNKTRLYDDFIFTPTQKYGFELNKTYAFLKCIPNDICAQFQIDANYTGDFWYKLFQNGAELTNREVKGKPYYYIETMAGACAGAETVSSGTGTLFSVPGGVALSSTLAVFALLV